MTGYNKGKKVIAERTLKRWRKEALVDEKITADAISFHKITRLELQERILRMTQELLDLHLIRK